MDIMQSNISVIIPLYNKAAEIERTLRSVLEQSLQPLEIIVVDDGSTDGSAAIVERVGGERVRLIRQQNRGVSAARNKGIELSRGEYVAFLDGDDRWQPDYLKCLTDFIARYPDCGAYGVAFYVDSGEGLVLADTPQTEGEVDFFAESMQRYVLIPSAATLRRDVLLDVGGFPNGMRMGEDQFLWTKVARSAKVAFLPTPLVVYSRAASNRSAATYRPEQTIYSFEQLYDAQAEDLSNEYIARVALGKAIVESVSGGTKRAKQVAKFFSYNKLSRKLMRRLKLLNFLPRWMRPAVHRIYCALAWKVKKRGL
jgi:glycosyltransferase involved in cell wall biosynthesis